MANSSDENTPIRGKRRKPLALVVIPNLKLGGAQRQAILFADELRNRGLKPVLLCTESGLKRHQHFAPDGHVTIQAPLFSIVWWIFFFGLPFLQLIKRPTLRIVRRLAEFMTRDGGRISNRFRELCRDDSGLEELQNYLRDFPTTLLQISGARNVIRMFKPSLIVSFLPKPNIVISLAATASSQLLLVERNDYCRQPIEPWLDAVRKRIYAGGPSLAANSRHCVSDLRDAFPNATVLWMPNVPPSLLSESSDTAPRFVVLGRLAKSKRVSEVILAFEESGAWKAGFVLDIWGDGPLRENLRTQIESCSAKRSIRLMGAATPVASIFNTSSILVLNSEFEGHPNVLDEALTNGSRVLVRTDVEEATFILGNDKASPNVFSSFDELVLKMRNYSRGSKFDGKGSQSISTFQAFLGDKQIRAAARQEFLDELLQAKRQN